MNWNHITALSLKTTQTDYRKYKISNKAKLLKAPTRKSSL